MTALRFLALSGMIALAAGLSAALFCIGARAEPTSLVTPPSSETGFSQALVECSREGVPARVISACTLLLESGRNSPLAQSRLLRRRAQAYLAAGATDSAFADFDEAVRLDANEPDAYQARARAHQQRGAHALAIADFDRAGARAPRDPDMLHERCRARAIAGTELDAARRLCNRALALRPDNPDYLDSRGLLELKAGRFDRALADYEAAFRWEPESAHALFGRGAATIALGRVAQGQADLARAIAMDARVDDLYRGYGVTPLEQNPASLHDPGHGPSLP